MATLEETLKLDSKSQRPHAKKSKTVPPRVSTAISLKKHNAFKLTPVWSVQQTSLAHPLSGYGQSPRQAGVGNDRSFQPFCPIPTLRWLCYHTVKR